MTALSFTCDAKACYGTNEADKVAFSRLQTLCNQLAQKLGLTDRSPVDGVLGEGTVGVLQLIAISVTQPPLDGLWAVTHKEAAENALGITAAIEQLLKSPGAQPAQGRPPKGAVAAYVGPNINAIALPPVVYGGGGPVVQQGGGGGGNVQVSATPGISMPSGGGLYALIGVGVLALGVAVIVLTKKKKKASSPVAGNADSLVDGIRAGDRVTITDRFGVKKTGRAVMRGPAGWVLNMGGRHGTPAIATDENTAAVRKPKKRS